MKSKKKSKNEAKIRYRKKAVKRIEITLLYERDRDIIAYLNDKGGATYIKDLIRADYEKAD